MTDLCHSRGPLLRVVSPLTSSSCRWISTISPIRPFAARESRRSAAE